MNYYTGQGNSSVAIRYFAGSSPARAPIATDNCFCANCPATEEFPWLVCPAEFPIATTYCPCVICGQGQYVVAIGCFAGSVNQKSEGVAIGDEAGRFNQGINSIAIGFRAGQTNQPVNCIILFILINI